MGNIEYLRQARNYYSQFAALQISLQGQGIEDFYTQVTFPVSFLAAAYKYIMAFEYSKKGKVLNLGESLPALIQNRIIELYTNLPVKMLAGAKVVGEIIIAITTTNVFSIELLQEIFNQTNSAAHILCEYTACYSVEQMKTNPEASLRIIGSYNKQDGFGYIVSCGFTNCEKELFSC